MELYQLKRGKILVIGDIILDEYLKGSVSRVSPEAPVPVLKPEGRELRLGGASNVAANVKALGSKVELVGVVGRDETGKELRSLLKDASIKSSLTSSDKTTIHKLRLLAGQQQLLRLDIEQNFDRKEWFSIKKFFSKKLKNFGAVIVSDYGKGTLHDVPFIIQQAKKRDIPVFIDPKSGDEYALARIESKVSVGYSGFEFDTSKTVTLEQDLYRRDLTINAIARNLEGELIDPYGGLEDIKTKTIHSLLFLRTLQYKVSQKFQHVFARKQD